MLVAALAMGSHCFCFSCGAKDGAEKEVTAGHSCCSVDMDEEPAVELPAQSPDCCCDKVLDTFPILLDGESKVTIANQEFFFETSITETYQGFPTSHRVLYTWPSGATAGGIPVYIKTGHLLI